MVFIKGDVGYWSGKKRSEETKLKISLSKIGKVSPKKGIKTGIVSIGAFKKGLPPAPHKKDCKCVRCYKGPREKHPNWKDNVSYVQLHRRVKSQRGNATDYPCAMQDKTCKGIIEWASISHKANSDIEDYIPLCRSHHRRYDLRNKK